MAVIQTQSRTTVHIVDCMGIRSRGRIYYDFFDVFKMKRCYIFIAIGFAVIWTGGCGTAKTGCPANEAAAIRLKEGGELPRKKGKSQLFPKKMRRKMKWLKR